MRVQATAEGSDTWMADELNPLQESTTRTETAAQEKRYHQQCQLRQCLWTSYCYHHCCRLMAESILLHESATRTDVKAQEDTTTNIVITNGGYENAATTIATLIIDPSADSTDVILFETSITGSEPINVQTLTEQSANNTSAVLDTLQNSETHETDSQHIAELTTFIKQIPATCFQNLMDDIREITKNLITDMAATIMKSLSLEMSASELKFCL